MRPLIEFVQCLIKAELFSKRKCLREGVQDPILPMFRLLR